MDHRFLVVNGSQKRLYDLFSVIMILFDRRGTFVDTVKRRQKTVDLTRRFDSLLSSLRFRLPLHYLHLLSTCILRHSFVSLLRFSYRRWPPCRLRSVLHTSVRLERHDFSLITTHHQR